MSYQRFAKFKVTYRISPAVIRD